MAVEEVTPPRRNPSIQRSFGAWRATVWTFHCDVMQPGMFTAFFQSGGCPLQLSLLQLDPFVADRSLALPAAHARAWGDLVLLPATDDLDAWRPHSVRRRLGLASRSVHLHYFVSSSIPFLWADVVVAKVRGQAGSDQFFVSVAAIPSQNGLVRVRRS